MSSSSCTRCAQVCRRDDGLIAVGGDEPCELRIVVQRHEVALHLRTVVRDQQIQPGGEQLFALPPMAPKPRESPQASAFENPDAPSVCGKTQPAMRRGT